MLVFNQVNSAKLVGGVEGKGGREKREEEPGEGKGEGEEKEEWYIWWFCLKMYCKKDTMNYQKLLCCWEQVVSQKSALNRFEVSFNRVWILQLAQCNFAGTWSITIWHKIYAEAARPRNKHGSLTPPPHPLHTVLNQSICNFVRSAFWTLFLSWLATRFYTAKIAWLNDHQ